jgi:hypothetical protein
MGTSIWDMSTSAGSNTSVQGVSIAEGCPMSNLNDAQRSAIAQAKGAVTAVATSGTDSYTATLAPAPDALTSGMAIHIRFGNANATTTPTLAINGLTAKTIVKEGSAALLAGDIPAGHEAILQYNGTNWVICNPKGGVGTVTSVSNATNGGLNVATGTSTPALSLKPSDLLTKATPTTSDSFMLMDAAASNAAKTALLSALRTTLLSGSVTQIVNTETGAVATGTTQMPNFTDVAATSSQGDQYMSLAITPTNASSTLYIDVVCMLSHSANVGSQAALFQDSGANAIAMGHCTTGSLNLIAPVVFRHKMTAGTTSATTFKVRGGTPAAGTTTFNGSGGVRVGGGTLASSITITEMLP